MLNAVSEAGDGAAPPCRGPVPASTQEVVLPPVAVGRFCPALGEPAEPKQAAPLLWAPNASVDLSSSAPAFRVCMACY